MPIYNLYKPLIFIFQQDLRAGGPPLRASTENQFPPHGFPGPSSQSGMGFGVGQARPGPPPPPGPATAGGGLNNLDGPGINVPPQQAGHFRAGEPMGPGGNPPNQLNNLNQPLPQVKSLWRRNWQKFNSVL